MRAMKEFTLSLYLIEYELACKSSDVIQCWHMYLVTLENEKKVIIRTKLAENFKIHKETVPYCTKLFFNFYI